VLALNNLHALRSSTEGAPSTSRAITMSSSMYVMYNTRSYSPSSRASHQFPDCLLTVRLGWGVYFIKMWGIQIGASGQLLCSFTSVPTEDSCHGSSLDEKGSTLACIKGNI
jgi:hypothetical protein